MPPNGLQLKVATHLVIVVGVMNSGVQATPKQWGLAGGFAGVTRWVQLDWLNTPCILSVVEGGAAAWAPEEEAAGCGLCGAHPGMHCGQPRGEGRARPGEILIPG